MNLSDKIVVRMVQQCMYLLPEAFCWAGGISCLATLWLAGPAGSWRLAWLSNCLTRPRIGNPYDVPSLMGVRFSAGLRGVQGVPKESPGGSRGSQGSPLGIPFSAILTHGSRFGVREEK